MVVLLRWVAALFSVICVWRKFIVVRFGLRVSLYCLGFGHATLSLALAPSSIAAVQSTYGAESMTPSDALHGQLRVQGQEYPYTIVQVSESNEGLNGAELFMVTFPQAQQRIVENYYGTGKLEAFPLKAMLFQVSGDTPGQARSVVVDEKATYVSAIDLAIESYIEGQFQLKASLETVYIDTGRVLTAYASQIVLYNLPGFNRLFAASASRTINGQYGTYQEEQQILLHQRSQNAEVRIEVTNFNSKHTKAMPFESLLSTPWVEDPMHLPEGIELRPVDIPSEMCVLVREADGRVIEGAEITVTRGTLGREFFTEAREEIRGKSDANGKYCFSPGLSSRIRVHHAGKYDVERHFSYGKAVPSELQITLEPEDQPVEMLVNSCSRNWAGLSELTTVGLSFAPSRPGRTQPLPDKPEDCDLELTITPLSFDVGTQARASVHQKQSRNFRLEISPKKGWKVQPAHALGQSFDDPKMRVAPKEGYVQSVSYELYELPNGFFLEKDDGSRYGKFILNVNCGGRYPKDTLVVRLSYAVQAQESGTVSLNPKASN